MNTGLDKQILLLEMKKALIHMDHCNIVATRENNLGGWLGDHTSIMSQYEADYNEAKEALELMESQSLVTKSVSLPIITDNTDGVNIHNTFNDYIKLQKKYDLLKSKSSAVLMEWDLAWDRHSPELCSLGSALKVLGDVLDKEIDRK